MYIHYATCTMEDSILQISSLLDFTPSTSVLETIEDTSFLNVISPTKRHHSSTPLKPAKRLKLDSTVSSDDSMNDSFNFNLNDTDNTTITYFDEEEQEEHSRAPNLPVRYAVSPENVSTYSAVHQDSADLFGPRTAIPHTSDAATDFTLPCTIFSSDDPTSSARAIGESVRTSFSPGEDLITTTSVSTATATLISIGDVVTRTDTVVTTSTGTAVTPSSSSNTAFPDAAVVTHTRTGVTVIPSSTASTISDLPSTSAVPFSFSSLTVDDLDHKNMKKIPKGPFYGRRKSDPKNIYMVKHIFRLG